MGWLAHAFALGDPQAPWAPEDEALLDRLASEVARRGMQAPAVLFLEGLRPLNFLGSQAVTFLQPLAGMLFSATEWDRVARILERREALGSLMERIEASGA